MFSFFKKKKVVDSGFWGETVRIRKTGLYQTRLNRWVKKSCMFARNKQLRVFRDEHGKHTYVKYKRIRFLGNDVSKKEVWVWKLDERSVRFMQRKQIIDNQEDLKTWGVKLTRREMR